jgi:hypothetical protein
VPFDHDDSGGQRKFPGEWGGDHLKKTITAIWLAIFAAMAVSAQAYGDEIASAVGKKVTSTMKLVIDGQQAAKDVIIIEGTSYLPVRVSAELFGYDVEYENRTVYLNKKEEPKQEPVYDTPGLEFIRAEDLDKEIARLEGLAAMYQNIINSLQSTNGQYSESMIQLIQEYYSKFTNVQMQLTYLKGYKDFRIAQYAKK